MNGGACGGLSHVQHFSRAGNMKPLGDFYKDPQLFERHAQRLKPCPWALETKWVS
jgi:hypothetical protein